MRRLKGTIISNKMQKTVVVRIDRLKKHPKYLKYYRVYKNLKVHDEKGEYRVGDVVIIQETKPTSREKRWKVVELIKRESADTENESSENNEVRKMDFS